MIARAIPRSGRSRAYVDGRLATVTELAELGALLVDLHGQHAHQSLLHPAAQRDALDRFAGVDLAPLRAARVAVRDLLDELGRLGGDERARARELDLVRYQVDEIDAAASAAPTRTASSRARRTRWPTRPRTARRPPWRWPRSAATATTPRSTARRPRPTRSRGRGGARRAGAVRGRRGAAAGARRRGGRRGVELRAAGETIDEDPERLEAVRQRRHLLRELRRKYGETLEDVIAEGERLRARLAELEGHDAARRRSSTASWRRLAPTRPRSPPRWRRRGGRRPLTWRRASRPTWSSWPCPRRRCRVAVEGADPGDDVEVLLAANPGTPPLPLAKVASGGELARTMLALRLVLTDAPPTLVFDEVDAGIGGAAARGRGPGAGRGSGREHQVLVVTHLPQVAAYADAQVQVAKHSDDEATVSRRRGPRRRRAGGRAVADAVRPARQRRRPHPRRRAAGHRGRRQGALVAPAGGPSRRPRPSPTVRPTGGVDRRNGRRVGRPRRRNLADGPVTGIARIDRRTKRLVRRLQPGDIAVINHEDLDRVAAETLVDAAAGRRWSTPRRRSAAATRTSGRCCCARPASRSSTTSAPR